MEACESELGLGEHELNPERARKVSVEMESYVSLLRVSQETWRFRESKMIILYDRNLEIMRQRGRGTTSLW